MKWLLLITVFAVVVSGCSRIGTWLWGKDQKILESGEFQGYAPRDPIHLPGFDVVENGDTLSRYWSDMTSEEIRLSLPYTDDVVLVQDRNKRRRIPFSDVAITGEKGDYAVYNDYMKYRLEKLRGEDGSLLGVGKVGVGVRVIAEITTRERNLRLPDLFSLAAEAQSGNLTGSLNLKVIGMESKDITMLMPMGTEINDTSISMAFQAVAAVKAKLYDRDVRLTPHIYAVRETASEAEADSLLSALEASD